MSDDRTAFTRLPVHRRFEDLSRADAYAPLPDDWLVASADIVGSTALVEAGRYKLVNMIGAAVIAAQMNARGEGAPTFPFVFAGDGASFACEPDMDDVARKALAAVRRWALDAYDVEVRAAIASVADLRRSGHDVRVARYAGVAAGSSEDVAYAMFDGGGVSALEEAMKRGDHGIPIAPPGTRPDLAGLSCRWEPVESANGRIVSLIVVPQPAAPPERVAALYEEVNALAGANDRAGHPIGETGPRFRLRPRNLRLEVEAAGGSRLATTVRILAVHAFGYLLQATRRSAGRFDPRRYSRVVSRNSDFRKISDRLMMTIDCDEGTLRRLRERLERAREEGTARFGMSLQDEAIITCIVPSYVQDDHIHFIDGADGGYTAAASAMNA